MSPVAFLQRPARWIQQLALNPHAWSAAPNFAFELSVRRTSDADLEGMDLGNVLGIISGSERIHSATIRRFNERFAKFNLPDTTVRPSYGLAEATLYVISAQIGHTPATVRFDYEKLSAGHAERCGSESGTDLVSYGAPRSSHDPHRRPRDPHRESRRQDRRDLGARRSGRDGLLAQPTADRAHLRRRDRQPVRGHAGRAVAARPATSA